MALISAVCAAVFSLDKWTFGRWVPQLVDYYRDMKGFDLRVQREQKRRKRYRYVKQQQGNGGHGDVVRDVQDHGGESDIPHGLVYRNEDRHVKRSAESGGKVTADKHQPQPENQRDGPVHQRR